MRAAEFAARQKLRFDIGSSFMAVINLSFVIVAASDKLATVVELPVKVMVAVCVPCAVAAVWLLGYALDKAKFAQAYQHEQNKRNEMLSAIHEGRPK